MARPWSARCYGVARQREGSRQNSMGGSGVLSLRHFGLVLFIPLARGCRRICRGERCKLWLMVSAGAMLLDRLGPPGFRFIDFRAPALTSSVTLTRARALMARPWSARCYGVARQREGSRQNSRGARACSHSGISAGSLYPFGAWVPKNLPRRKMQIMAYGFGRRDAARPAWAARDLDLLISGPRVNLFCHPYAREGADGQAVVCPLLRGSSPTRGVAPKQHGGLGRALTPAFRAGSLYPFGAWVPKNLPRRKMQIMVMVSAGAMLLDRLGPPGFRFIDFRAPALTSSVTLSARGR